MIVSAAWIGAAMLAVVNQAAQRRLHGASWGLHDLFFESGGDWLVCALLTPAIFAVSRRWPLAGPHLARRMVLHLGLALLFWAIVGIVYQGFLALLLNHHVLDAVAGLAAAELVQRVGMRVLSWTLSTLLFGLALYLCIVGIEHAIRHFVEARDHTVQMARLSEQLTGARFAALQAQLNPHFLFNTLNTIAVRARDGDGAGTVRMVEQLSEVLRRTLGRQRANEVTLGEELELVREYLAIEQARFPDHLRPSFEIDESAFAAAVPSFALQHLVENAIRHGISKRRGAGRVRVIARRNGDTFELSVIDDGVGIDALAANPKGHGIANTQERLEALYGERASLEVSSAATEGTVATLRVPYRELAPEADIA